MSSFSFSYLEKRSDISFVYLKIIGGAIKVNNFIYKIILYINLFSFAINF